MLKLLDSDDGHNSVSLRNKPNIFRLLPGLQELELSVLIHNSCGQVNEKELYCTMSTIRKCLIPFTRLVSLLAQKKLSASVHVKVQLCLEEPIMARTRARIIKNIKRTVPEVEDFLKELATFGIKVKFASFSKHALD